nr:BRO family protein [uncultured Cohaesibacter sp.]
MLKTAHKSAGLPYYRNSSSSNAVAVSTFTFADRATFDGQVGTTFDIRTVTFEDKPNDPWFVAADVCKALDITNTGNAYRRLNDDEKTYIRRVDLGFNPGRDCMLISEAGLYKLILRSDKPQAKKFQDWVTRDVLPTIRKTEQYNKSAEKVAKGEMSFAEMTMRVFEGLQEQLRLETEKVAAMKPKAEAYEHFLSLEGTYTFTDAAKMLGMSSARALTKRLNAAAKELTVSWL